MFQSLVYNIYLTHNNPNYLINRKWEVNDEPELLLNMNAEHPQKQFHKVNQIQDFTPESTKLEVVNY